MAQAIPLVGALGGATINVMFTEHFNSVARYHFGLRLLERRWGGEAIRTLYREAALQHRRPAVRAEARTPDYDYRKLGIANSPETGKPR
jgi:hypothetical protein